MHDITNRIIKLKIAGIQYRHFPDPAEQHVCEFMNDYARETGQCYKLTGDKKHIILVLSNLEEIVLKTVRG